MPRTASATPIAYVALLRGINVGGKNMVSMKSLKQSFERMGFKDVATYINSGNVLFRSTIFDPRKLESRVDAMLAKEYGLKGPTVVRSHREMAGLKRNLAANWNRQTAEWRYNVIFLTHAIDSMQVLDELVFKPDIEDVVYCPGTLLWRARISDITRSGMVKLASKQIYKQMTIRNLNTTKKIIELLERMQQNV